MKNDFQCPHAECRQWITLPGAMPHQSIACPHCGRYVTVPPTPQRMSEGVRGAIVLGIVVAVAIVIFLLTGTIWIPGCGSSLPI